jgi:hypothetical protein
MAVQVAVLQAQGEALQTQRKDFLRVQEQIEQKDLRPFIYPLTRALRLPHQKSHQTVQAFLF